MTDTDRPPPNQCSATTLEGARCRQLIAPGADVCIWHGPSEAAREARQRGNDSDARPGRKPAEIRTLPAAELPGGGTPPQTLEEVATWFGWLTVQLATGRLDYRVGREIGHALTGYRTALEKKDLLAKVGQLHDRLDTASGKHRGRRQPATYVPREGTGDVSGGET
jgi:hypothetical protein